MKKTYRNRTRPGLICNRKQELERTKRIGRPILSDKRPKLRLKLTSKMSPEPGTRKEKKRNNRDLAGGETKQRHGSH